MGGIRYDLSLIKWHRMMLIVGVLTRFNPFFNVPFSIFSATSAQKGGRKQCSGYIGQNSENQSRYMLKYKPPTLTKDWQKKTLFLLSLSNFYEYGSTKCYTFYKRLQQSTKMRFKLGFTGNILAIAQFIITL